MSERYIPDEKEKVMVCYHCGNKTLMKKVADYFKKGTYSFEYYIDNEPLEDEHNYEKQWNLYECSTCENVTLEEVYWDDYEVSSAEDLERVYREILYPHINASSEGIPDKIRERFKAILKVKNIDNELCMVGVRMVIESICKSKGINDGTIEAKIQELVEKGILPKELEGIAHLLRKIGNKAVHGDDVKFSDQDVEDAIICLSIILDNVYVAPYRAERLSGYRRGVQKS